MNNKSIYGWETFANHGENLTRFTNRGYCRLQIRKGRSGEDQEVEFNFKLPKKQISSISVTANSTTFGFGKVKNTVNWVQTKFLNTFQLFKIFCSGESSTKFAPCENFVFLEPVSDSTVSIKATIIAPDGWTDVGELFRQKKSDASSVLEVRFKFKQTSINGTQEI